MKQNCIKSNRLTLPKMGDVKIILHRPIPDGFKIKTGHIVKAADGYYVTCYKMNQYQQSALISTLIYLLVLIWDSNTF
jgi:hypothetical protein